MIKSLSVFLLVLLTSGSVLAQIKKGSILLGGSVSVAQTKYTFERQGLPSEESTASGFRVGPSFGFAYRDNAVAGFGITYKRAANNGSSASQTSYSTKGYALSIFTRNYLPLSNKFYLFGDAQLIYSNDIAENKNKQDGKLLTSEQDWVAGFAVSPGVTYAVSRKIHLEAALARLVSINYNSHKSQNFQGSTFTKSKSNGLSADVNVSPTNPFQFTFRFVLGK